MAGTSLDDFNELKPAIDQMSETDTVTINMPFKHYLQECMIEYQRLCNHREFLEANHMDFTVVDTIPQLISACREILSQFSMINFPSPASRNAWEKGREEGEALLYDLKAAMDYAFQDYPELLSQVSVIRQGASNADFIQDLNDSSVLCRENRQLLEAIHYGMENVERASVLAKELSGLLAQSTLDKSNSPELRIDRDKCFTILKKNIDATIRQARFIYRHERKIAAEFMIRPPRRRSAKAKKAEVVAESLPN
jgi:hypothetical protein